MRRSIALSFLQIEFAGMDRSSLHRDQPQTSHPADPASHGRHRNAVAPIRNLPK